MIGAITKPTQFLGPWFLACVMLSDDGVALSYALVADVCVTADQDAHLGSCLTTEPAIISLIAWCRLLAFGAAFAPPQKCADLMMAISFRCGRATEANTQP